MSKATFEYWLSIGHPLKVYCRVCWWASANMTTEARYCPYGHGELAPFSEYSGGVDNSEECPAVEVSGIPTEKPDKNIRENIPEFWLIDPTGTPVEQRCMGCGFQAVLPYPADCPTCQDWPRAIRMVLCETWPELLKRAESQKDSKPPAAKVIPKAEPEGQLSLFGATA